MSPYLQEKWQQTLLLSKLKPSGEHAALLQSMQDEIVTSYSEPHRHYHTLVHLEQLFAALERVGCDDVAVLWSVWYHDIVYRPSRADNEAKSARIAEQRLQVVGLGADLIAQISSFIEATEHHQTDDALCQLFLDADMAILGVSAAEYQRYTQQVAKEFKRVPKFLYRRGRKAFVKKVLAEETIFKTPEFKRDFEAQARQNLNWELNL